MTHNILTKMFQAYKKGVKIAEEISIRTGVPLVVMEKGEIVEIPPKYKYVKVPIKSSKKKKKP